MKYLSVCSGIEAATVAWHPLGWQPVAFGEIEKFPCQVLEHHYPDTQNWGDMTKFKEWPDADVNVFVGGTPCQSFSVAGLRKGLDDPRGNLMLTYLAIAARYRPRWLVWENVPGVLSSNGGLDFASLLRGMGELGYGFAYRILDAQYFGVAQRRRRVFVVGYLGNWRPAAAVLFERHSLSGHPAPSRKAREGAASNAREGAEVGRIGNDRAEAEAMVVTGSLCARTGKSRSVQDAEQGHLMPTWWNGGDLAATITTKSDDQRMPDKDNAQLILQPISLQDVRAVEKMQNGRGWNDDGTAYTVDTHATQGVAQPIPFDTTQITSPQNGNNPKAGDPCHPLAAGAHPPAIATHDVAGTMLSRNTSGGFSNSIDHAAAGYMAIVAPTLTAANDPSRSPQSSEVTQQVYSVLQASMAVRRLTPKECERLQGFPDNYTDIKPKGKATPDGPRYKALGNSMAVPVMAWIGKRIQEVDAICQTQKQ